MVGLIMTDRVKQLIEYYIPGEPDQSLDVNEYFYLQYTMGQARVIRVFALDVFPLHDGIEYGIYQQKGTRLVRIDAGYGSPFRGVRMCDLYDNREDCKNQTHMCEHNWERLREIQRLEA